MSIPIGLAFEYPNATSSKPHYVSYATARTVADDGLFEVWNGPTNASRVLRLNKDGQMQFQDGAVGAPALAPAGDKTTGLYFVSGTPEIAASIAGSKVLSVVAAGIVVTGTLTASGGGSLTGTWSDLGSVTTVDINGGTVGGVTLDGTISGTPTWASSQAITLSTAAQPNVTSLGTLASLAVNGSMTVTTVNGIDVNPGSDVDADLVTVGVTGAPIIGWDESANSFTSSTHFSPRADDGASLGVAGQAFSDLFLASGSVINFANGDVLITHSANVLTVSGLATLAVSGALTTTGQLSTTGNFEHANASASVGFYGATAVTQQTVTGSRGGNAALASLLTALATLGLVVDSSS